MNESIMAPLKIAVIGAGVRGTGLARKIAESGFSAEIIAVAEPDDEKRKDFAEEFKLSDSVLFKSWEDLTSTLEDCDAAVIATLDNQHTGPALASLNRGWHILIEKPLADSYADCQLIDKTREEKNKVVAVCHTLRFMNGFSHLKKILDSGTIGQLVHIDHFEAIGHLRFVHNYVRGRWAQVKNNTFLLLHKCCHDIDFINWLVKEPCRSVSSFGSLKYFTRENAPEGSTQRCIDNCTLKDSCQYSAIRIYTEGNLSEWPAKDICKIHTPEAHTEKITNGPYGLCVWHANNDVVDHQSVLMEFEGGTTATCTLSGYSATNGRRIRLQGTHGEVYYEEALKQISIKRFADNEYETVSIPARETYHPEDKDIIDNWISSIIYSTPVAVDTKEATRTLAVVFAAELSRKENRIVDMTGFTG
jgi:predicted dehydrogenase